ncbi:MAG: biopolymer transporter ExbD [Bacteroidales bacterium]|nr:biopolymer transporter ExbD [Bacteroidales bacterium]MCF8457191.1 biopolymer transporter ExbD [Bacteroidales bacterium]
MARATPEINGGSLADIAFLLLIFFLVTTTMDVDSGLSRKLPPIMPDDMEKPPDIKERNVFIVLINSKNQLQVEGKLMSINNLREEAKEFIKNPRDLEELPEKKDVEVEFFGVYPVSKQVISLMNDRGTSYETYIAAQNELAAAYNELRDEISMQRFGKKFEALAEEEQEAVKKIYPQRISEAEPRNVGGK